MSRRLAAAMLLSLMAIQAQAFLQISLFSKPELRLVGTRWFAEFVGTTARDAFALPPDARAAHLATQEDRLRFRLRWRQGAAPATTDDSDGIIAGQLAATIRDVMGDDLKALHIRAGNIRFRFPTNMMMVSAADSDVAMVPDRQPIRAGAPDVLMHAELNLSLQGRDGTWIDVESYAFSDGAFGSSLPWAPLFVGGIIIALVSAMTARRIVAPLDPLVIVAERVGTAREPMRVETTGLHEFASVARAFEDMQQRLLRFVEDRTRILAAISHDLRTSLTRLRLTAEQCGRAAERAALKAEIDEMSTMVESTLAFASGEAQLAPTQTTDVAALLISLVDGATDLGKDVTYGGPNRLETMAHPVSLKRAFWNVIDNGLKYGKRARVTLRELDGQVVVTVSDDGSGIPPEAREDVFTPFRRLDPSRSGETLGVGLTIARDVMQSHGGSITLRDGTPHGLVVEMRLPRRQHRVE
jgi:signal transduction histidine kinase